MELATPLLPPDEDLGLLCLIVTSGFNDAVLKLLAAAGFGDARVPHGFVVQGLLAGDKTVTELAGRLGITVQAVSKTVNEMERLGYIEKSADPDDGRSMLLSLTGRALQSVAESRRARFEVQRELVEALGEHHAGSLIEALRLVAARFGGLDAIAARRLRPGP